MHLPTDLPFYSLDNPAQLAQRVCVVLMAAYVYMRIDWLRQALSSDGCLWRQRLLSASFFCVFAIIGAHSGDKNMLGMLLLLFVIEDLQQDRLKNQAQQAELRALNAQIEPHFINNILNAIKALIRRNPDLAAAKSNIGLSKPISDDD